MNQYFDRFMMREKFMKIYKIDHKQFNYCLLFYVANFQTSSAFAASDNVMFGVWGSVTLLGDFKFLAPMQTVNLNGKS